MFVANDNINPNFRHLPYSSSFYSSFSPFDYDFEVSQLPHDLFMPHFQQNTVVDTEINMEMFPKEVCDVGNLSKEEVKGIFEETPRKRSVKKDRHSKIATAQGLRDRRMRLSLEIARKFFNLQDTLGFDKASKTVEWLMVKAKTAIKEVSIGQSSSPLKHSINSGTKSVSSISECEVVSGIEDQKGIVSSVTIAKKKKVRQLRQAPYHPLAKESRAKARERARKRMMEKMGTKTQKCPSERGEQWGSHSHNVKSSLEVAAEAEESGSHSLEYQGPMKDIVEDSLPITSNSIIPSMIFNYNQGICDIETPRTQSNYQRMGNMQLSRGNLHQHEPGSFPPVCSNLSLQSQFADDQFRNKLWERIYKN
ncbi:hypothetical protein GIB67_041936 [Kingdonia uniflora]|uniref:Cycloidea-like protein n=1 Tax=Kingdonia uniflora TaxID=39325 RepID=A0A7J7N1J8_9MAGN|nr:hypothetical protein GIB67_041936 [Kingdonia uniflora]